MYALSNKKNFVRINAARIAKHFLRSPDDGEAPVRQSIKKRNRHYKNHAIDIHDFVVKLSDVHGTIINV